MDAEVSDLGACLGQKRTREADGRTHHASLLVFRTESEAYLDGLGKHQRHKGMKPS